MKGIRRVVDEFHGVCIGSVVTIYNTLARSQEEFKRKKGEQRDTNIVDNYTISSVPQQLRKIHDLPYHEESR